MMKKRLKFFLLLCSSLLGISSVEEVLAADATDCSLGTVLFREDFGGNNVSDPLYTENSLESGLTTLIHQPNFPLATSSFRDYHSADDGCYDIRKRGFERLSNGAHYSGWYWDFDDHTSEGDDTRGYFMQVDMASSATIFYSVQMDGLCENSNLYLSMWGHPVNESSNTKLTLKVLSTEDGSLLASEDVVISCSLNAWQQVGFQFTVPAGETSVIYQIFSEGGNSGNDFALDDIEVRLCNQPATVTGAPADTLCEGNCSPVLIRASYDNTDGAYVEPLVYTWYKNTKKDYTSNGWVEYQQGYVLSFPTPTVEDSGFYRVVISSSGTSASFNKCSSASDIIPVIVSKCKAAVACEPKDSTFEVYVCEGNVYQDFEGKIYSQTGVYTNTLKTVEGCDSVVTMKFTVLKPDTSYVTDEVSYETTTYNKQGFVMTDLAVGHNSSMLRLTNIHGCDSIVFLDLVRKEPEQPACVPYVINYEQEICKGETYHFEGSELGVTKLYTWTYKKSDGCDSIIHLQLTVVDPDLTILRDEAYLGDAYSKNGFQVDSLDSLGVVQFDLHLSNTTGCDSTVVLYLTVKEKPETLFIPTSFTPHTNDGMNDTFMPGYEVYIYDRYGNMMVHSENGWDGTYKNEVATSGVYVYALKKKDGDYVKGTIEIVKSK